MKDETSNAAFHLRRFWGVVLLLVGLFTALSVFSYDWHDISVFWTPPNSPPCNLIGPVGAWLSFLLFMGFGLIAYLLPFVLLGIGFLLLLSRAEAIWPRLAVAAVLLVGLACAGELAEKSLQGLCGRLNIPDAGGIVSHLLVWGFFAKWLSPVGAGIVIAVMVLVPLVLLVGWENIAAALRRSATVAAATAQSVRSGTWKEGLKGEPADLPLLEIEETTPAKRKTVAEKEHPKPERSEEAKPRVPETKARPAVKPTPPPEEEEEKEKEEEPPPAEKPAPVRKPAPVEKPARPEKPPEPITVQLPSGPYQLPPVTLLQSMPSASDRNIETDSDTMSRIIVETLAEFGIEGKIDNVERGPVVTRFELSPAPGVRVEKIAGLSNNLALSLKATSVRVQAPVPGKGVVGIEVPNANATMVCLREMLEGETYRTSKARLPLVIGKDVAGTDLVADLADMPHLLIAGATGSGKTVCMNAVLAGLLMSRTPQQLRLMLVDPKIVEFAPYRDLPHLVVPVITQPQKVAVGLRWAINEMEKRYKLFAKVGVRNIESYNNRVIAEQEPLFPNPPESELPEDKPPARIPYIVIVVDELADLMLTAQAEIENCIARLAQLSRAVGIHMILSTQRPSVNVITGTIKANFPARIAFQVAQKVDSRTILDSIGAEKLLGRGDMLFQPPGVSKLVRAQGALTSDADIRSIVEFIRKQVQPSYEMDIQEKIEKTDSVLDDGAENEELIEQAIQIIRETNRASTSALQRRLRIGYTRAARVMDILEERGVVGPPRGSDPREILVDLDAGAPAAPAAEEPEQPQGAPPDAAR